MFVIEWAGSRRVREKVWRAGYIKLGAIGLLTLLVVGVALFMVSPYARAWMRNPRLMLECTRDGLPDETCIWTSEMSRVASASAGAREQRDGEAHSREARLREDLEVMLAAVPVEPPLSPGDPGHAKSKGPAAVARISGAEGVAAGAPRDAVLSDGEIMSAVAGAFSGFKACVLDQLRADPDSVPERVTLTFSIANGGSIERAGVAEPALRDSPLRACLLQNLTNVRFRASHGGVRRVEYPITVGRPS